MVRDITACVVRAMRRLNLIVSQAKSDFSA